MWILAILAAIAALGSKSQPSRANPNAASEVPDASKPSAQAHKATAVPTPARTMDAGSSPAVEAPVYDAETYEVESYTVRLIPDEEGTWDWSVWPTIVFEGSDDPDGLESTQGYDSASRDEAAKAAHEWIVEANRDSLNPLPVEPQPDAEPLAISRRGIRISGDCQRINVTDIGAWIEHASDVVSRYDAEDPDPDVIMRLAFATALPECRIADGESPTIRGKDWATVRDGVASVIAKILAGEWLSIEPVEDVVAARIVDMSAPSRAGVAVWHEGKNNGNKHAIVAIPRPGGTGVKWWVWIGPRRKWDEAAKRGTAATKEKALEEARRWADSYFNSHADQQS